MEAEQKEIFRNALLQILDGNRARYGLGVPAMQANLVRFGFPGASDSDVLDHVDYWVGKKLVEEVPRTANPENRTWRITSAGIAYVDENL
jgi:hypothetical protein